MKLTTNWRTMRKIQAEQIGKALLDLITELDPIDEDIGIVDDKDNVLGVIINNAAYNFFLKKVEEEEDRLDRQTVEEFRNSGEKNDEK